MYSILSLSASVRCGGCEGLWFPLSSYVQYMYCTVRLVVDTRVGAVVNVTSLYCTVYSNHPYDIDITTSERRPQSYCKTKDGSVNHVQSFTLRQT